MSNSVRDDLHIVVILIYNKNTYVYRYPCNYGQVMLGRTPKTIVFYLVISKFPTRLKNQNIIRYYQFVLE